MQSSFKQFSYFLLNDTDQYRSVHLVFTLVNDVCLLFFLVFLGHGSRSLIGNLSKFTKGELKKGRHRLAVKGPSYVSALFKIDLCSNRTELIQFSNIESVFLS